ncbi:hypothetical protein HYV85_02165 [Candidatus Woesearchaeota archaeon]|nr:hypothetical protein [Candidatus Woesearchaeota archaeon]
MNELVLLAEKEDKPFALEFSRYISTWFPLARAVVRDYSHPEGGGRGNLVFAKIFFPLPDYYTLLRVIRVEENKVFVLSKGREDHREAVRALGLEGVIYSWDHPGFDTVFYSLPLKPQHPGDTDLLAEELLKQYACDFEQLKQSTRK